MHTVAIRMGGVEIWLHAVSLFPLPPRPHGSAVSLFPLAPLPHGQDLPRDSAISRKILTFSQFFAKASVPTANTVALEPAHNSPKAKCYTCSMA